MMAPAKKTETIHAGCGGTVIADSDFVSGEGDEFWWDYRCEKCGETFQTTNEFLNDE